MTTHKMYTDGIRPPRGLGFVDAKDLLAIRPNQIEGEMSSENGDIKKPRHETHNETEMRYITTDQANLKKLFSGLSDWLDMLESANFLAQFFESRLNSTFTGTGQLTFRFEDEPKAAKLNSKKN